MNSGVYRIQSRIKPERIYIGSAKRFKQRWQRHIDQLKGGTHHSKQLQHHVNKYGINDLQFIVVVRCELQSLLKTEQFYLDTYKPYFNTCKVAGNNSGCKHSEESKRKISQKLKNRVFSEDTKRKISEAVSGEKNRLWGKKLSSETVAKKSIAMSGCNNHRFGKSLSDETKRKISLANKGRKMSQDFCNKLSHRVVSEETRQKLSKAGKGMKKSPETRERMRKAQAIRFNKLT